MKIISRRMLRWMACASAGWLFVTPVLAQDYPTRTIRFVVPYSAGSPPDVVTRVMAAEMSRTLGQPTIVENKPGADTVIGYEYIARQMPADGYTVAIAPVTNMAILPLVAKDLRFDPVKDLPPFISLVEGKLVFGVSSAMPWKTFQETMSAIKANPKKWNYGSPSVLLRFPMLVLIQEQGLDITHIPYATAAPYYRAVIVNDVQMGFIAEATAVSTFGDKFRVLGVTGETRSKSYPDAPTFAALGYPQLPSNIFSFVVRAGTPQAIVTKLHGAAAQALRMPEVRTRFNGMQFEVVNDTPQTAEKRLADQARLFSEVAKKVGIQPQ